jgi:CheY-like chemotaxis protein
MTMNTILIVEDDRDLRHLYKIELEAEGYRILEAANGIEAKYSVERETPDLIIMDIRMPEKDGTEAMNEILMDHADIRVILNTSFSFYQDDFSSWGADAYILKSGDLAPLKTKVRELLPPPAAQ